MVIRLLVQPIHWKHYKPTSGYDDPVATALRDYLGLKTFGEMAHAGPNEIFLVKDGIGYVAEFDSQKFISRWQGISRAVTLKFRELVPI